MEIAENVVDYIDLSRKTVTVYVVAFLCNRATWTC